MTDNIEDRKRYEDTRNYRFWIANDIRLYIFEFLKKEFPGAIIIHESDQVNIFVLDENLPIDIQIVRYQRKGRDMLSKNFGP